MRTTPTTPAAAVLLGNGAVASTAGALVGAVFSLLVLAGPVLTLARLAWASCTTLTCLKNGAGAEGGTGGEDTPGRLVSGVHAGGVDNVGEGGGVVVRGTGFEYSKVGLGLL